MTREAHCGALGPHEPHTFVGLIHDYPIECPGEAPRLSEVLAANCSHTWSPDHERCSGVNKHHTHVEDARIVERWILERLTRPETRNTVADAVCGAPCTPYAIADAVLSVLALEVLRVEERP